MTSAASDSLTALFSLTQLCENVLCMLLQQSSRNEEKKWLIQSQNKKCEVLAHVQQDASDRHSLLDQTLLLIHDRTKGLQQKDKKLHKVKQEKLNLQQQLEKSSADFNSESDALNAQITAQDRDHSQIVAEAVAEVTARFSAHLLELDEKMAADEAESDAIRSDMFQTEQKQQAKLELMRKNFDHNENQKRHEYDRKTAKVENDAEKLNPEFEGWKLALMRETDAKVAQMRQILEQKRDQRMRLDAAVRMLPENEVRKKLAGWKKKRAASSPAAPADKRAASVSPVRKKKTREAPADFYRSSCRK